ncbi:TetR/AcrR family transcriptional regulator [Cupriavidus sp. 2TAF22]|uniref:TetR/AcrR family transcriptional regulator n=1 Tax=unclassified Cupriavidus TaxID=2640874 RepID=UPI003F906A66
MEDTARARRAVRTKTTAARKPAKNEEGAADPPAAKRARAANAESAELAGARPYHHGNLREELVRCGKEQLKEVGLAELSLRRIASSVGVSQVAPRHHFGNKEGLLAAIAASGFRDLTEFRLSHLRPSMSPEQRLRSLLSSYVAFAKLHPTLFHLMFAPQLFSAESHAELDIAASQSYQTVARATAEYLAENGNTDEDKAHEVARVAWMSMHGVATLIIEKRINPWGAPKVSREQLVNQALDLIFSGIKGRIGI